MKKLVVMVLLAVFAVGCTKQSVAEQDYDNGIQLIDRDEIENPRDKGKDKEGD